MCDSNSTRAKTGKNQTPVASSRSCAIGRVLRGQVGGRLTPRSDARWDELSLSVLLELGYPPFANKSLAIRVAVQRGKRADPGVRDDVCLMIACYNGYTEIVRPLLADSSRSDRT